MGGQLSEKHNKKKVWVIRQVCLCVCVCMHTCMCVCSCVQFFLTPWIITHQAALSVEFSAIILERVAISSSKAGLSLAFLPIWVSWDFFHHLLPGTERDTPTNGYFPYKCKCLLKKGNFYSIFRASPLSVVFLKITS